MFFSSIPPYGMEEQSLTQGQARAPDSLIGRDRGKPIMAPSGTAADAPFGREHKEDEIRSATRSAADDQAGRESQAVSQAVSQNRGQVSQAVADSQAVRECQAVISHEVVVNGQVVVVDKVVDVDFEFEVKTQNSQPKSWTEGETPRQTG